jgi:aminoglycoside 2'-N-acetyltransferase I
MNEIMQVRRHIDLTTEELDALEKLFDSEYRSEFGVWNPDAPYGYSPADTHVLPFRGQTLAAHVGFQRRSISVGTHDVIVAGTGGVLVDERSRGTGLGVRAMRLAQEVMRDETGVDFGFLGCRREVVPFMSRRGGSRFTPRNGVCLAWTRRPSSCPRAGRTSSAPAGVTRASGRKATSIFGARPGDRTVPVKVPPTDVKSLSTNL